MKALLAFLVTFSVFANDQFATQKETTLKRLQADKTVATTVVTCVEGAKTMDEMAACEKAPETQPVAPKVQAKAPTSN